MTMSATPRSIAGYLEPDQAPVIPIVAVIFGDMSASATVPLVKGLKP